MLILMMASLLTLVGCDIHEYPKVAEAQPYVLRLEYETALPIWNNDYTLQGGVTSRGEVHTKSVVEEGQMRYVIRTYPQNNKTRAANTHVQEFTFTRDLSEGYDNEFTLDLLPGNWRIMVWSDMLETSASAPFYDYGDFAQIKLQGRHRGNTDHRDAFRGYSEVLNDGMPKQVPDTLDVPMSRPLAKFEFLSDDLKEFIDMEVKAYISRAEAMNTKVDPNTKVVDINSYRVKIIYPAFMPNTYSMFSDKPIDSAAGVMFDSGISQIDDHHASMGFDYVFVQDSKQSAVTVQMAIYNKDDEQISLTVPVDVPLRRGYHTILKGSFLMQKASGGIGINPEFEGDHNIIL